ncbi:MAG: hypothetical protein H6849_01255 [Alphaproteobacteria bacterium]|nr:MAG: hypothetical protein H6849_01255 [Alphaproteobacteria bacterium]
MCICVFPLCATPVSLVIAEIEREITGVSETNNTKLSAKTEPNLRCRTQFRQAHKTCTTDRCRDSAITEFRFCTVSVAKIAHEAQQKASFEKAEVLRMEAVKPDSCMTILQLRTVCGKNTQCKSALWQTYQSCLRRFDTSGKKWEDASMKNEAKLSPSELKEFQISIERLQSEASQARAKLEEKNNKKMMRKARKQLKINKRKLKNLSTKNKKLGGKGVTHKSDVPPIVRPKPLPHNGKPMKDSVSAPGNIAKVSALIKEGDGTKKCQQTFIEAVQKCQKRYQLNPIPRFDNAHVECVRTAHTEMTECGVKQGILGLAVPYHEDIHLEFEGQKPENPQACEKLFASDLDKKCGKNWSCRNRLQQKAWMCKALVSLPK